MLTIGQLASYAHVTVRAVRHYHQVGLLPEPPRDASGYRSYDAAAVVRLIRIRTLADAGVPLSRVHDLLDADAETFARATEEIDRDLREQIRQRQEHRRRIRQLASGDTLAVPDSVSAYLELVRATGVPDDLLRAERDAWIVVAAQYPDHVDEFMRDKVTQLEDPRTVRFYQMIGESLCADDGADQEALAVAMADLLAEMFEEASADGRLDQQDLGIDDAGVVQLLDSMASGHPLVVRLRGLLAERGWSGWTRVERS